MLIIGDRPTMVLAARVLERWHIVAGPLFREHVGANNHQGARVPLPQSDE